MRTKKKQVIWFLIMFLVLYLSTWITGTQVRAEDVDGIAQDGTITVYNDTEHNGHFYYYKDGVPITLYCYHHERKQPSQDGTSGYIRYDYFSEIADEPWQPVTKEMIATVLYLAYPANATGLVERWNISKWDAIDRTQEVIWAMIKGDRTDYLKDYNYPCDLQYYAQNEDSPYFNKMRNMGLVELPAIANGEQEMEGVFRSETLTVRGDFTGTFGFDTLPEGVRIYDEATDMEITGKQSLEVGKQFYIRYTGQADVGVLQLPYSYDTHEVFYLKTNDPTYQDMVGTEVKTHTGMLELHLKKEPTVSYTVTKKWEDAQNQDGIRPAEIRVQLKADGVSRDEPVVLNEANGWSYRWENLPELKDGKKIQYQAEEVNIPDGYTSSYQQSDGETVITNTHVPENLSKTVTKLWKDDNNKAGKRPDAIQVQLKANGTVKETVKITEKNGWKYTWEQLPKYQGGQEIVYTVEETDVPDGYEVTIDQKKFEITNTILNQKQETIVLPETGGQGTSHLYQSGMLLILAAVGMIVMYKKKKEYESYEK